MKKVLLLMLTFGVCIFVYSFLIDWNTMYGVIKDKLPKINQFGQYRHHTTTDNNTSPESFRTNDQSLTTGKIIVSTKLLNKLYLEKSLMPGNLTNSIVTTTHFPVKENLAKNYITIAFQGRLGNLLFEYASLYGIAKHHNMIPVIDERCHLKKVLKISAISCQQLANVKRYNEVKGCTFENNAFNLDRQYNWTLNGYFQSWKYFVENSEQIRKELQFKDSIQHVASNQFHEILNLKGISNTCTYIAVHVRRGDMVHSSVMTKYGYTSADKRYIDDAMASFQLNYSNPFFIFSSDDISWCKTHFTKENTAFILQKNSPEVDMAIMTNCNHSIITTGSYGWWVAWLIGGKTIYYKKYPVKGSELDKVFNSETYRPPSWIAL
ncbi:galactoside alpha-(1,2)-fucosyltransferase 2-like [Mytilus californianus]|uniref:galactoside alpha-(1,2)-fucosyltransferase 2-like n=1 Tax=Mytilus californianus TaxID=6549 RepID=UPI0022460772|nr:galactoside alpha-(1,2)-fucosyltransferase 2-like [Mytilus californianus]